MKKLVKFGILILMVVLALPAYVTAQVPLTLQGNLAGEVEITLNDASLSNTTMVVGANTIGSSSYNISSTAFWWVTVSDPTGNDGYLTRWNSTAGAYDPSTRLTLPVQISNSIGLITLNSTEQVHWYGEATSLATINFEVRQGVSYGDKLLSGGDWYQTVIQFVATNIAPA